MQLREPSSVSRRRLTLGRDVVVVDSSDTDVYLEGRLRLRPGSDVELSDGQARIARVETWAVARLGQDGTIFRGVCRWLD